MWKVHADVLKMAKTEEKKERIKWFQARSVLLDGTVPAFERGLLLACECRALWCRCFRRVSQARR